MTEQPPGSYPPPPPEGYPPPPPAQAGGYPPPASGYPPPASGYPGAAPAAGTNGLAIASLVCSVVGVVCGIGSILGIVLGIIAMNQIKRTGQGGRGLALAGIIVGAVLLALGVIGYIIYFSSQ